MLEPDYYYTSVYEIPFKELWEKKYRGLIFDLDNTLTEFDRASAPPKVVAFLNRLKKMGFKVTLLTNNTTKRLDGFNKTLGLYGIANAAKPLTFGIKKAMHKMGTLPQHTIIIGDQVLSDIWGGKNAKITTILVKPITERDFFFVKFKRHIEKLILKNYFAKINAQNDQ